MIKYVMPVVYLLFFLSACAKKTESSPAPAPVNPGTPSQTDVEKLLADYKLVWSDEFSGSTLDATKWKYRGDGTVRNYATVNGSKTVSLDGNGYLKIKVIKENGIYYVGHITTDGFYNPTYGYYECRAKMNSSIGPHVAFWLQSGSMGNQPYNDPANNGAEIDIFEYHRKAPVTFYQTIHINGYGTDHKSFGTTTYNADAGTGFHTFGLLWTSTGYTFYVDGKKVWYTTDGLSKRSEYMILSTELTGFGGDPSLGTYPDEVSFDYVRVYQPK